jgi:hypothetical protein
MAVYAGAAPAEYAGSPLYSVGLLSSERIDDIGDALEYGVEEQL